MFELLNKVRRAGMLSIEMDIEKPEKSVIFNAYPDFIHDLHVRSFVCDTMRMAGTGGVGPFDMDQMMDLDIEVQHRCANQPISALTTVADSLPGLGIVAAVLGVVITMGALGGPHEAIGHKVAAALAGPSSAFCCATAWSAPLAPTWARRPKRSMPSSTYFAF